VVAVGVTSVLNFAPVVLSVPEGVDVRKVDLSIELQILAFHEQRKAGGPGDYEPLADGDRPSGAAHYVEAVEAEASGERSMSEPEGLEGLGGRVRVVRR
jgi:redox-sensing transcriptional repressor